MDSSAFDSTFAMTSDVLHQLRSTIGCLPAESGGMLGGCRRTGLVSHYYFDGTADRTRVTYSPDVARINRVLAADWKPAGVELMGFVHSHPSGFLSPSGGDLVYARAILGANPNLSRLFLPIVQSRSDANDFALIPYVASAEQDVVKITPATIKVVDEDDSDDSLLFTHLPMFMRVRTAYDLTQLERSRVIGVGCGGSASFLEDLARAGVGEFVLIDPDVVAESNLATQQTYRSDIGCSKVRSIGARIRNINPLACVVECAVPLDALADIEVCLLATTVLRERPPKMTLLCGMTDDFYAQARVNRLALNFGLPSLCAQVYAEGRAAEVTFTHPDVTPVCHRCVLASRYAAYLEEGFQNTVGSDGTPFASTARLNALKQFVALAILHHGTNHSRWGGVLRRIGTRNLVQIRLDPDCGLPAFELALGKADSDYLFCDDAVWISQRSQADRRCPDCGETGDLKDRLGRLASIPQDSRHVAADMASAREAIAARK